MDIARQDSVTSYIQTLTHNLFQEVLSLPDDDFTIAFSLEYHEDIQVHINILSCSQGVEQPTTQHKSTKVKLKKYKSLLQAKEEEIQKLREELRKVQKDLPITGPGSSAEVSKLSSPLSSNTEKSYQIRFSRNQSPVGGEEEQFVFSRKSSWDRPTQTEEPKIIQKTSSRHLATPSLVDDTFHVAIGKTAGKKKRKHQVFKIEDDSSSEDEKGVAQVMLLSAELGQVPLPLSTVTDLAATGHFQHVEMCTQTEEEQGKNEDMEGKREECVGKQETRTEDVEISTENEEIPVLPKTNSRQEINAKSPPEGKTLEDYPSENIRLDASEPVPGQSHSVIVSICVTNPHPPLINKPRRLEHSKRPKKRKIGSPKQKHPEPRPKSELPRGRGNLTTTPSSNRQFTNLSISTKSSKSGSENPNRSLRSTVPSFSEWEDPAVRQNLMHYLKSHKMNGLRPVSMQASRYQKRVNMRRVKATPAPRSLTPITELLYTGIYNEKNSWKNVVQVLRNNPNLLSKFISSPVQGEDDFTLPVAARESANASLKETQGEDGKANSSARISLLSRSGRRYRVLDYTPSPGISTPQPPSRDNSASSRASPALSQHGHRPVSRQYKAEVLKDWSHSPLDADVTEGHYNFNWQQDVNLISKPELTAVLKLLKDAKEPGDLALLYRRALKTVRKLQSDLFITEHVPYTVASITVSGVAGLLNDCLRLLRMRQLTISVLHYLHQREEAVLSALTDSRDDNGGEGQVQQISKLMLKALKEWREYFPTYDEFIYLGQDYLSQVPFDVSEPKANYFNTSILDADMTH